MATTVPSSHRPRVLVVDDDEAHRESLAAVLEHAGYDVQQVGDGAEAMELLTSVDAAGAPRAIITDRDMPHMSGEELVENVRSHPVLERIPILLLTGSDAPAVRGALVARKPIAPRQLLATVQRIVAAPDRTLHEMPTWRPA